MFTMVRNFTKYLLIMYILFAGIFPASAFVLCITSGGHIAIEPAHSGHCENIQIKHLPILYLPIHQFFKSVAQFHIHISLIEDLCELVLPSVGQLSYKTEMFLVLLVMKAIPLFSEQQLSHMHFSNNLSPALSSISTLNIIQTAVFLS